jgi:aminomuconate-semialdehyde/2-hydroxymuconate-6-semialdehyde dehydrogenase
VYLWTSDLHRAHRLALALGSAHTWVNSRNPQDLQAPSAGRGPGGPGAPGGSDAIDFYTQYQADVHGRDGRLAGNPRSR